MIKQAILDYGLSKSVKTFEHDRSKTIGASEIGQCARRVRWSKDASDKPHEGRARWGATLRGNLIEEELWLPAMRGAWGARLVMAGEDQQTFIDEHLSATPDGLLVNLTAKEYKAVTGCKGSGSVVVECKSIDPRVNLTEARAENQLQVQAQMGLIRKLTHWHPSRAVITYINASFLDDIQKFVVEFDPEIFKSAEYRARMILQAPDGADLRPEGLIAGGKECEHCRFFDRCAKTRFDAVPTKKNVVDPQFRAEIEDACSEIKKLQSLVNVNEELVNTKKQELKERLAEKGVRWIDGVVSWSSHNGRQSYDMDAIREVLKEFRVNVDKFKKQGTPGDRLQIL